MAERKSTARPPQPRAAANSDPASARWEAVHAALKHAILSRGLRPGMKLPEDEIGAFYSVSRTIVRAALQALAHEGLVMLERNRGAFIATPDPRQAREVFEARALIEPRVAAMAAQRAGPADVARLRAHVADEHAALAEDRHADAVLLSARFHETIAEIADHAVYAEFVRLLCSRSALIISLYWRRRATICESTAHDALIKAIAAGDEAEASATMTSHLVDLLYGIDLSVREEQPGSLSEILKAMR